jgi:hypothetical protein
LILFALAAGTRPGAGHAQARALDLSGLLAHAERHAPALLVARARLGLGRAALRGAEPALADNPELELAAARAWSAKLIRAWTSSCGSSNG